MSDVLVTYASKYGSTREVAEAIAETLGAEGLDVEVQPARKVRDLSAFRAVVVGGGLYIGRWHRDARRFLRRQRKALADVPIAIFALGPLSDKEEDRASSRDQLDRALGKVAEVRPCAVEVFGGVIDPAKLRFPFSHMPETDARDWDEIGAWAKSLPAALGLVRERETASV